ncbi:MAG: tetratricopeptide repeat protein, partial [Clostridia bacterium]|nr:tetratricopeptide repeat protein [Clostridia bacterium]
LRAKSIPTDRVIGKADEYFSRNDYAGAERHFLYWLEEANEGNDDRGAFVLYNELMGLYRKTGRKKEAFECVDRAVELIKKLDIADTVSAGTAFVNAGTVYKAFGMAESALPFFDRAVEIYERELKDGDGRLGGLYNNKALALTDVKRFSAARENYLKALRVMEKVKYGELERAITYLNLADLAEAEYGAENAEEEISRLLSEAEKLLNDPSVPQNGYYAFVCEKCASAFGYHGFFAFENELKRRAEEIYERA